jgi:penicillin-binding protein 2
VIPSRAWKLREKGERWWPGETLSVAIGQSFLMTTPLQIARMIGGIFTGYLVKPCILLQEECQKIPLMLQPATITCLKESMRFVITRGTGLRVNTVKDIEIYAKTSTAQVSDFQKRTLSEQFLEHAWFVAHFQYKDFKPLVLVILVENAGTSQVATTIAKKFLIQYKDVAHLV